MGRANGLTQTDKTRAICCQNNKKRRTATVRILMAVAGLGSILVPFAPHARAATQFLVPSSAVHSATFTVSGTPVSQVKDVVRGGAVYLPVNALRSTLQDMGITTNWNGNVLNLTPSKGSKKLSFHPADSNQKGLVVNNRVVATGQSFTYLGTTYLAMKAMMVGLGQAGIQSSWDGHTFAFVKPTRTEPSGKRPIQKPPKQKSPKQKSTPPSKTHKSTSKTTSRQPIHKALPTPTKPTNATPGPMVYTFALEYSGKTLSLPDLRSHDSLVSTVAEFNAYVTPTESLNDETIPRDVTTLPGWSNKLQLTVANLGTGNFNGSMVADILSHPSRADKLVNNIVLAAVRDQVSGINLDFEQLPPSSRADYSAFVAQLHQALAAKGKSLVVDVPAETAASTPGSYTGAYDYAAIGKNASEVVIMAYDYSYPGGPPGAIAPVWWVNQVADYTASQMPSNKVLLGVPTYAYDWASASTRGLSLGSADSLLRSLHVRPLWNSPAEEPYYTYYNNNGLHTVYYEDTASLKAKLLVATRHHFAGIAFWRVGLETSAFWNLLSHYRLGKLS